MGKGTMYIPKSTLGVTLRLLAAVWLIGWATYVTFWAESHTSSISHLVTGLGILLIPAGVAIGVAWGIDITRRVRAVRLESPDVSPRKG
jgi:hypothetical protein